MPAFNKTFPTINKDGVLAFYFHLFFFFVGGGGTRLKQTAQANGALLVSFRIATRNFALYFVLCVAYFASRPEISHRDFVLRNRPPKPISFGRKRSKLAYLIKNDERDVSIYPSNF